MEPHVAVRGKSHGFSRVAAENWVIFSSMAGMILQSSFFFSGTSGLLSSYQGHLCKILDAWKNSTDASRGEA